MERAASRRRLTGARGERERATEFRELWSAVLEPGYSDGRGPGLYDNRYDNAGDR